MIEAVSDQTDEQDRVRNTNTTSHTAFQVQVKELQAVKSKLHYIAFVSDKQKKNWIVKIVR